MKIAELDLSVRTANALGRAGIRTVEQLQGLTERELMGLRGFGNKCLNEVREKLCALESQYSKCPPEKLSSPECYRLGGEDMRNAILWKLKQMADRLLGAQRGTLLEAIEEIERMEI